MPFTTEELDRTFRTNVYAMFWLCRAALPRMKAGTTIINTASIQAYDPSPNLLAYAPTKAAIVNFTKALSPLAMKKGVRVNAVAPGVILLPEGWDDTVGERLRRTTPLKRLGSVNDVVGAVIYLVEADYVTGETIVVDGGRHVRR